MFGRIVLAVGVAGALLAGSVRAAEVRPLREEIRVAVAEPIKKLLDEEKQEAVAVGAFTGPPRLDTNAGPGIQQLLAEELEGLKVRVRPDAELTIKGRYARVEDADRPGQIAVRLTAEVLDRHDERRAEFHAVLRTTADIVRVLAVTARLPLPDEPGAGRARNQEVAQRLDSPAVHVAGGRVSASEDSPYAVEVLTRPRADGPSVPRPAREEGGAAFVDLRRDEVYVIRIHNNSPSEVAVAVTIDGLSVFAFSAVRDPKTGAPAYDHYLVGPHDVATIPGWHLRDRGPANYASFLVTEYGKGASARAVAAAQGRRGVITVTFAPAYAGQPRSSADETGLGPPRSVDTPPVERSIGPVREAVSIRYTR